MYKNSYIFSRVPLKNNSIFSINKLHYAYKPGQWFVKNGFFLIELLVALFIFTLGASVILKLASDVAMGQGSWRMRLDGLAELQNRLESGALEEKEEKFEIIVPFRGNVNRIPAQRFKNNTITVVVFNV